MSNQTVLSQLETRIHVLYAEDMLERKWGGFFSFKLSSISIKALVPIKSPSLADVSAITGSCGAIFTGKIRLSPSHFSSASWRFIFPEALVSLDCENMDFTQV